MINLNKKYNYFQKNIKTMYRIIQKRKNSQNENILATFILEI